MMLLRPGTETNGYYRTAGMRLDAGERKVEVHVRLIGL